MFRIEPHFQSLLRHIGLTDAWAAFEHPSIQVWRSITERENATIDVTLGDGRSTRLHLKRDKTPQHDSPSGAEAAQLLALAARGIPTASLVAYGWLEDGRSFVITEDLAGYQPADKVIEAGLMRFDQLLAPTANLAAKLHSAGAFHRDLYMCHMMVRPADGDVRLIDCARVLIKPWWPARWRTKDLAQFVHSTRGVGVAPQPIEQWLDTYAAASAPLSSFRRRMIARKADWIALHDKRLRARQPDRNVSIPD